MARPLSVREASPLQPSQVLPAPAQKTLNWPRNLLGRHNAHPRTFPSREIPFSSYDRFDRRRNGPGGPPQRLCLLNEGCLPAAYLLPSGTLGQLEASLRLSRGGAGLTWGAHREIERRLSRASHGDCRKSIMQPNFQEARPGSLPLKRSNPMLPAPHARSPAAYELTDAPRMLSTLARFVPSFVNFAVSFA